MMKHRLLFLVLFFLCSSVVIGQEIKEEKVFGGTKFTLDSKRLTYKKMSEIMAPSAEASEYIKKAKSGNTISSILSAGGGALIGWSLGRSFGGEDINWTMIAAGTGLAIIAIPIYTNTMGNTRKAVSLYNESIADVNDCIQGYQVNMKVTGGGLVLNVRF